LVSVRAAGGDPLPAFLIARLASETNKSAVKNG
jgi:hypothetical protein